VISAHDVLPFAHGAGHFSAFLQYIHGLRALGCDVWWMERLAESADRAADRHSAAELERRLSNAGLAGRLIVYTGSDERERDYLLPSPTQAQRVFDRADLLLNFDYELDSDLLARFARTALVDIDPGLLQLWIAEGELQPGRHDVYFTTGETVGTPRARFPACGIEWTHIRPPVSIEHWRETQEQPRDVFTTVSSWWSEEWVSDGSGANWYENNKRASFLEYLELPRLVSSPLELALNIDADEEDEARLLERHGWRVARAREVTRTPPEYRSYIQRSRGEFSCAKPSCMRLRNAWISDRTLCYLASGRPAVVQHTGPSALLEGGGGLLRFSSLGQAADAINSVCEHYGEHCAAARELAATHFDARKIAAEILDAALGQPCAEVSQLRPNTSA
jgi:hypothetical protein